ncbi:MAG: undecaprenyldiphospho-muramoylpentapeptide beta-N-acetylglucosaminyltransferase [Acidobacteriota bacterium]|nr:undecaprenyldiphospho-muramoylpentapeptide beta-N-acetylglucosaminyltransferase [Acidobacteriota bacterium]
MNYMIAGGGTGGHIFPAAAIAEALKERRPDANILFVGTRYGMEKDLIPKLGYPLLTLPVRGLVGKGLKGKLASIWRLPLSLVLSLIMLLRYRPKVVIGVGGYASAPLLFMAGLLRFPTMIQEQNAWPGLTNRLCSRMARLACCGFAEAAQHLHCPSVHTGNPVRGQLREGPAWTGDRKTLLVLGGSQGARSLNTHLPTIFKENLTAEDRLEVVHQCGRNHAEAVEAAYGDAAFPVTVTPFIDDMSNALDKALLVICRAGASTIGELKLKHVPAMLVPFPAAAGDHQTFNARSLSDEGAAVLVPEPELPQAGPILRGLLDDREKLVRMAVAAKPPQRESAGLCADIALALQQKTEVSQLVQKYSHVS